jgi:dihydroorotate dehydrogenase electron transfer subunit
MEDLVRYDPDESIIYACGPLPMITEMAKILLDQTFPCQVSMEERMACGVGACLGCMIEVADRDGRRRYERVCREGPVFDIRAITRQL